MFPRPGRKPVSENSTADVLAVILPISHTKTAMAQRVKGRISSIMRWAIVQNYIDNNPASDAVAAALPQPRTPRQRHLVAYYMRRWEQSTVDGGVQVGRQSGGEAAVCVCYPNGESNRAEARLSRWSEAGPYRRNV